MAISLVQSNQVVSDVALNELASASRDSLATILPAINTALVVPGKITALGKVFTVGNTTVSYPDGRKQGFPLLGGIDVSNLTGTYSLATGVGTADVQSLTLPTMSNGDYIQIGFEIRSDKKIYPIFGTKNATPSLATFPGFSSSGMPLGSSLLSYNAGVFDDVVLANITQYKGAGSGGGSSGAGAAKSPADGFKAIVSDTFDVSPSIATSKIDSTYTTGVYSNASLMYEMACDKTRTVTISGTTATLSSPTFTVTPGCILWVNSLAKWARIVTVNSQISFVLDYAIGNVSTAACMVAQAVWTKDLVNYGDYTTEKTTLRNYFPSVANLTAHVEYSDSLAIGDNIADQVDAANVVVACSNEGLQSATGLPTSDKFGNTIFTRPAAPNQIFDIVLPTNTNKERFFACFFPNPNNVQVSVTANVINYDISLYAQTVLTNGGYLQSAFTMSDGSGTEINCSAPTLVSGNTQITLSWDFIPGINSGLPDGDIEVVVDGQIIPRFFTSAVGLYWKEVVGSTRTIEINGDLTVLSPAVSIHVRRRQGSVDTSTTNTTKLMAIYDAIVGSASDVTSGRASYSSAASAIAAISSGSSMLILPTAAAETFDVNKDALVIVGKGYNTLMTLITVSANYCDVSSIRATNWTVSGAHNFVRGWIPSANTLSNTGTDNAISIVSI